jgi:hypothetical protein
MENRAPADCRVPAMEHSAQTAMTLAAGSSLNPRPINALEEGMLTTMYTFDVLSSLDGYGRYRARRAASTATTE